MKKVLFFIFLIPFFATSQECVFESLDIGNLGDHIIKSDSRCSDECLDVCGYDQFYQIPVAFHVINSEVEDQVWPTESVCEFYMDEASAILGLNITLVRADDFYPCVSFYNNPPEMFTTLVAESGTTNNELEVYNTSRYDPTKILNIYYVRYINGPLSTAKGGSRSPFSSGWTLEKDGIFLSKNVNGGGEALAHELGHYLGLLHVWGNAEFANANCHTPATNCTSGDLIPDTPTCRGPWPWGAGEDDCVVNPSLWPSFNGSLSNPFCSSAMIHPCDNIMAYGDGRDVVTPGQYNRMTFTINTERTELFPEFFNFKVDNITSNSAILSWNRSVNSDGYEIRYKKSSDNNWTTVIIEDEITENYLLENLEGEVEYIAEIKVSCENDYTQVTFTTICDLTVLCDPCVLQQDRIITSTMIFDQSQVSGDLIINGGATLTINQKVEFRENSRVIMNPGSKLIIDANGLLTKCEETEYWKGVVISGIDNTGPGFAQGGEVEIRNGGTIEYAEIGVTKQNSVTGNGPGGSQFFTNTNVGKLTMTTGARIRNCIVGVEFNSTGGSTFGTTGQETSTIDDSYFEDNRIGVRLKGNRGLTISESTFSIYNGNIGQLGITIGVEIINSFVDILYNDFINLSKGIFINAPYPVLMGSNIIGNTFQGDVTGQLITGGYSVYNESLNNAEYLNIQNNTMINYDIYNLGLSTFIIRRNDLLYGYHAITSSATGPNVANVVENNTFLANDIGNNVDGINDIEYLTNCFEHTEIADIGLGYNTTIDLEQGDDEFSAGNCFVDNKRIQTVESFDSTTAFKYYTKDGENYAQDNCKHPGEGDFSIIVSQFESEAIYCGSGTPIFGDLPEVYRDCEQYYADHGNVPGFIEALEAEIEYLKLLVANGQLNNWVANRLIAIYQSCIDKATKAEVIKILQESDDRDREEAITFLTDRDAFRYHLMAYGLMVDKSEYSRARTLLNSLSPDRDDEVDFIAVQQVFLDYLEAGDSFKLADSDRDMIYDAGEQRLPLSGFARTVYYSLTGGRHFIIVPTFNGTPHNRVVKQDIAENTVRIYPNPILSDNALHIDIKGDEVERSRYQLEIYNSSGELIVEDDLSKGQNNVHIDNAHKGLLFVRIKKNGEVLYTEKLIRL